MALLGFNLVLSLISVSILQKLSAHFSFARWLICKRLFRFVHPTNEDLRQMIRDEAANGTAGGAKGAKKRPVQKKTTLDEESFQIPKSVMETLTLESVPLRPLELVSVPYYVEYRWLLDFTLWSCVVYVVTEIFNGFFPGLASKEMNLSLLWCLLLAGFSLKALASVTALYFRSTEESGERNLCLSFGAIGFLLSMGIFVVEESWLELGVRHAYENFTETVSGYLQAQGLNIDYPRNPVILYFGLSVFFGVLSAFLTFPCFRYSKMFLDALKWSGHGTKLFVYLTFFAPLFSVLLFIRPFAKDHLVHGQRPLLKEWQLESLKIWSFVLFILLRFATVRPHLQAYLNLALDRLDELRLDTGRVQNLDLQRMIARIYLYFFVAAVQFFAPILLILSFVLMTKTLGGYSWFPTLFLPDFSLRSYGGLPYEVSISLMHLAKILNPTVCRGMLNLLAFWTTALTFLLNVTGVLYYTRFVERKF